MKTSEQRTQDILERAERQKAVRAKRITLTSVLAAGMALVLALCLFLFIPYNTSLPNLAGYADSPYYGLMQKLNVLTYRAPSYSNNFQRFFGGISFGCSGANDEGDMGGAAPEAEPGGGLSGSDYAEVTDNQESGVIEGDLFKRTNSHIFYLNAQAYSRSYTLYAYTIAGEESALCGSLTVEPGENRTFRGYAGSAEMYLSDDGDTVTVFTSAWNGEQGRPETAAISLDVSDPANMRETGRMYVSGQYVTSRKVGDDFLLVSNFAVDDNPDFDEPAQYLPEAGAPGDMQPLPAEDIVWEEDASAARYTVVCRLGEDGLDIGGHYAFLSYAEEVYVSQENIFVTRGRDVQFEGADGRTYDEQRTRIACLSYAEGDLALRGSADVAGTVLNQYSMDEEDGILRVVTTESRSAFGVSNDIAYSSPVGRSASVYCVDLDTFTVVGSLQWFSPLWEEVTAVRFDGDTAYVCTAEIIVLTDPVFAVDLSDPAHITYTDTGVIEGYSFSLVDFTDGTLLGIGYDEKRDPKIEIYEQTGTAVESVCDYVFEAGMISETYKAFFIDRANGLLGLHVLDMMSGANTYVLLHFDGYELRSVLELPLVVAGEQDSTRATVVDGYLYVLTVLSEDFTAVSVADYTGGAQA